MTQERPGLRVRAEVRASARAWIQALLLFITMSCSPAWAAEEDGQLVVEEDGITVHERRQEGRELPILVGATTMAASPAVVASWIRASHTHPDWMEGCVESRDLRSEGLDVIGYNRIGMPWPVSDRDVVFRATAVELEPEGIGIRIRNVEATEVPEVRGLVRIPRLVVSWDLIAVESGTSVVYTVDTDPGGGLPDWLVRRFSRDLPFLTLQRLRAFAEDGMPPPPA